MARFCSERWNDFLRHKLPIEEEDRKENALNYPPANAKSNDNAIDISPVEERPNGEIEWVKEQ
jgi:hypothetical protein